MSYNRIERQCHNKSTFILLAIMKFGNLAISTLCSRVLLCLGLLYFCHSFIQAPVLLSVFLSPAKTFCSACMTLSGVKKQGRSSSSFHKHLSILTNKATCNSYKQVPVLLSLLYSSACTFVTLIFKCLYFCQSSYHQRRKHFVLCLLTLSGVKRQPNSSFLNYKISTSTSTASSRVLLFPGSCTFLINGENILCYACMTLSGVKKQGHSSSAYLYSPPLTQNLTFHWF